MAIRVSKLHLAQGSVPLLPWVILATGSAWVKEEGPPWPPKVLHSAKASRVLWRRGVFIVTHFKSNTMPLLQHLHGMTASKNILAQAPVIRSSKDKQKS